MWMQQSAVGAPAQLPAVSVLLWMQLSQLEDPVALLPPVPIHEIGFT